MATIKQEKAFKSVVENGGNVSKAMREVGYTEATAKTPQKLTESKGWKELLDLHLSEDKLAKEHGKVLSQDKDLSAKNKAIDMGYKLRGSYEPEKVQYSGNLDITNATTDELRKALKGGN